MPIKSPGLYVNDILYQELTLENCGVDASKVKALITQSNTDCVLPEGIITIHSSAFYSCANLANIVLPNTVLEIESSAFNACRNLVSIILSDNIERIAYNAFWNCDSLNYTVDDVGAKYLGSASNLYLALINFDNTYITNYAINSQCKIIAGSACSSLSNLIDITIPEGVTNINYLAFSECDLLPNIVLPSSVVTIDDYAFQNCYSLKNFTCKAIVPPTLSWYSGIYPNIEIIFVPEESVDLYKNADNWSRLADKIEKIRSVIDINFRRNAAATKEYINKKVPKFNKDNQVLITSVKTEMKQALVISTSKTYAVKASYNRDELLQFLGDYDQKGVEIGE